MIFDTLNNFANYARLAPGTWAKLAAFLHGCTAETPAGRYEIDGDRLYAMVQSYNLHPVRPEKLEIHRNYVDIQLLLAGRETIVYRPVDGLPVTAEYDAVRDIAFYHLDEKGSVAIPLEPGNFALFFPEEGHLPGNGDPADSVVKVVVKIERSLLEG